MLTNGVSKGLVEGINHCGFSKLNPIIFIDSLFQFAHTEIGSPLRKVQNISEEIVGAELELCKKKNY